MYFVYMDIIYFLMYLYMYGHFSKLWSLLGSLVSGGP